MDGDREFGQRLGRILPQGLGLSVDVYQPDLMELMEAVRVQRLNVGYLEIFKTDVKALELVRSRLLETKLAYHGEGIWVTQPDIGRTLPMEQELASATTHLRTLASPWITLECATKQMAGYSFGTYLPPLYSGESVIVITENVRTIQRYLDHSLGQGEGPGPLLLLEMPPLTYFGVGALSIPTFFARIAKQTACGLVFDIGHLWTVYRYTGVWRRQTLQDFASEFFGSFPMERVVEIHLAGLAERQASTCPECTPAVLPRWIDAHGEPIADLLFDLLDQALAHPRLTNLKGIALEVDTKPIPQIVRELARLSERVGPTWRRWERTEVAPATPTLIDNRAVNEAGVHVGVKQRLHRDYDRYAKMVTGQLDPSISVLLHPDWSYEDLHLYQSVYLPHEILHWGGELRDMFPRSCQAVEKEGVSLSDFVGYWFQEPRPVTVSYDFFLLKIERFVGFVAVRAPTILPVAAQEAEVLRAAYQMANEGCLSASKVGT